MSGWTLGVIAQSLSTLDLAADARPELPVTGLSTDTRTLTPGSVFVPLVGESFDGHDYVQKALDLGAVGVVWGRPETPDWLIRCGVSVFPVADTTEAYQTLGLYHRKACGARCIGITGSVGKTTTKEFLAHLLSSQFKVHKSSKNFNNDIGVPLTLLELRPEHDVVIVEMGMRGPGQIARLVRAAEPEVGLITGIGTSHLELLGSRENIARAKSELVQGLPADGRAILPAGDEFFPLLQELSSAPVVSYGTTEGQVAPERIVSEGPDGTVFVYQGREHTLGLSGRHHLHDLMASLAAGQAIGADVNAMLDTLSTLRNPEGRAEWMSIGGARFFVDAYNSAPESLRAALSVVASCAGRKIAVLGDMLELGSAAVDAHEAVGRELPDYGVEMALCVGPLSKHTVEQAGRAGVDARWFSSKDELAQALQASLSSGDTVLVKASRGMALETIVNSLKESQT